MGSTRGVYVYSCQRAQTYLTDMISGRRNGDRESVLSDSLTPLHTCAAVTDWY
jgi:hypothetical protein